MIRYGFACKVIGVPDTSQASLKLAQVTLENVVRVSQHNLQSLEKILRFCHEKNISLLRISSDIIPFASHPQVSFDWRSQFQPELAIIGQAIRDTGIRVSMHPGQYTILNSPKEGIVERAVEELRFHAAFLDAIGGDNTARVILHLGGGYGDKAAALNRLIKNLKGLPYSIRRRLALENDERIYTIEDTLNICELFSLPALFDVFHHSLNPPAYGTLEYWLDKVGTTWTPENGRQKIHYSQQLVGGRPGMHSQTIYMREFLTFHKTLGDRELDIMLEVKDKNLSAIKCANLTNPNLPRKNLTDEWARYKYLVLEHDPNLYKQIRGLLKADKPSAETFYAYIEKALQKEVIPEQARNVAQHVWGYVNSFASPGETKQILEDIQTLEKGVKALSRLKRRLFALAKRHEVHYLLNSLYFYI